MGVSPYTLELVEYVRNVNETVHNFGIDAAYQEIKRAIDAHNKVIGEEVLPAYASLTSEDHDYYRHRIFGIPLRTKRLKVDWSYEWLKEHTVADLALQYTLMQTADCNAITIELKRALYHPDNDIMVMDNDHPLRGPTYAFCNGDNEDGWKDHSHYMATPELTPTTLRTLINNVIEHGIQGELRIFIHDAQSMDIWNMRESGDFVPLEEIKPDYNDPDVCNKIWAARNVDSTPSKWRCIGHFDGYEVWLKPWVIKDTVVAMDIGTETVYDEEGEVIRDGIKPYIKPFICRQPVHKSQQGLLMYGQDIRGNRELKTEDSAYPLVCDTILHHFTLVPHNRHMAAILQLTDGDYSLRRENICQS